MNRAGRLRLWLPLVLVLVAFAARAWQLDGVPPGWSDDELSNIFVIAQKIFAGDYSVYYTDATGLEAPYHVVSGIFLRLLGFNALGIRVLSAFLGTLTIPLTYQLARRLFDHGVAVIAAAALAISFWSLIYSRVNLRHISLPVMALATLYWFWRGVLETGDWRLETNKGGPSNRQSPISSLQFSNLQSPFLLAGLFLGLSLYTYFAARGLPLILGAFVLYVALFDRNRLRRRWRGIVLCFLIALAIAAPLVITLQQETGADARIAEVAVPLVEARAGNFEPLLRHIRVTLSMFHADGDDEHLYNIPHRPVFGAPGAIFLWSGVLIGVWYALQPLRRRLAGDDTTPQERELAAAFLLLWWLAGISPGFFSVPPASLGHTILAQPATYILLALPITLFAGSQSLLRELPVKGRSRLATLVALLVLASVAWRDLPDYFVRWPAQSIVRFLYHADAQDVAEFVARHGEPLDFAISGLLAGPWDRLALMQALENEGVTAARPRWYHAQRAAFLALDGGNVTAFSGYPHVDDRVYEDLYRELGPRAGAYRLSSVQWAPAPGIPTTIPSGDDTVCFENGLCLLEAVFEPGGNGEPHVLHLTWRLKEPLRMPLMPLFSKPPPPDIYSGPRLLVFAQRWRDNDSFIAGDDGLWVDPLTLQPGDVFRQQHRLGTDARVQNDYLLVGLYDPFDGRRIPTVDGREQVRLDLRPPGGQ